MFYTYLHRRIDTGEVFYVGKGKGRRAKVLCEAARSVHWRNIFKKAGGRIVEICAVWSTEEEALHHEVFLIDTFRRLGCRLCNLTDGGGGASGHVRSPETTAKQSATMKRLLANNSEARESRSTSMRALWQSPAGRQKLVAALQEPATKAKRLESLKKSTARPEYRSKQSASLKAQWMDPANRERFIESSRSRWDSSEFRQKMSASLRVAMATPEYQKKISDARRLVWSDPERRAKHSKIIKAATAAISKHVKCHETGVTFDSIRHAAASMGLNSGNVSKVCRGLAAHSGGFTFSFAAASESTIPQTRPVHA